jgi:polyphosphate kinase
MRNLANSDGSEEKREGASVAGEDTSRFLNRELSWLQFNERVLAQSESGTTPLLERANFLSIVTSNLDEFVMKRVGGLKRQVEAGLNQRSADGRTPHETLAGLREGILALHRAQAACYRDKVRPALAGAGIHLLAREELTEAERIEADSFFERDVFPALTPLAVDPAHPFPFISNLSVSLAVALEPPGGGDRVFARVKVPQHYPGWVRLQAEGAGAGYRFVSLQSIIENNLDDLFAEMKVCAVTAIRVTRNADVEADVQEADDLLEMIEDELQARRFAEVVRLEHAPGADPWILGLLKEELELGDEDLYEVEGELDYTTLRTIYGLYLPELKYEPWVPVTQSSLVDPEGKICRVLRRRDVLVHHPFDSFTTSVERFVSDAADDPAVITIKMCLYRTGDDSPLIAALMRAARAGKEVVCLLELKARFDEARNISGARLLERAGVHVVYGVVGLKTHSKVALVVRAEADGLRCYTHIGTGNYHAGNARLYTDLGLLTSDPAVTRDVVELFNFITGRSLQRDYEKLLVAPQNMRERYRAMIEREVRHRREGRPAGIVAKMNQLEDVELIEALYEASSAGVHVDLIIRGFCCLRPGVPGLSENIRVVSIVGRFLEHSRIVYFRNGAERVEDGDYYIGSADWMRRSLSRRVEAATPVEDPGLRLRIQEILDCCLADRLQSWELGADGNYRKLAVSEDDPQVGVHDRLMGLAGRSSLASARGVAGRLGMVGAAEAATVAEEGEALADADATTASPRSKKPDFLA